MVRRRLSFDVGACEEDIMSWKELLYQETRSEYYKGILQAVERERKTKTIYPPSEDVFNAFKLTLLEKVQVVILGQDPYHRAGQAHGLSFSVRKGVLIPPSLSNIFKEIRENNGYGMFKPSHGDLTSWAKQGVLLLNSYLTVEQGKPLSHSSIGWELFTDKVITLIDKEVGSDVVYLLWGSKAQSKKPLIRNGHVLTCAHPSPYSVDGFLKQRHFERANNYLWSRNLYGIEWDQL